MSGHDAGGWQPCIRLRAWKVPGPRYSGLVALRRSALPAITAAALWVVAPGCGDDAASGEPAPAAGDAAAFVACPDSIPEFAVGLSMPGDDARVSALLLDASRFPARKYGNEWTLQLVGPDDAPLEDAVMTHLEAFMPVHGHYGRPPARFEALAEAGQVRAEIHFMMRGPWEVRIDASSASAGDDHIVVDVCVEE